MRAGRSSIPSVFGAGDPKRLQAELQHAISFLRVGQADKALAVTTRLVRTAPKIADIQFVHGSALDELKRGEEAIVAYQTAVRLNPNLAPAWLNLTLALTECGKERADAAVKSGLAASQLAPGLWNTHYALARAHMLKQQHAKAARALTRAIEINPRAAELFFIRGRALTETSQFHEAIEDYRKAQTLGYRDANLFLQLSSLLQITGDFDAARAVLAEGRRHHPNDRDLAINQDLVNGSDDVGKSVTLIEDAVKTASIADLQKSSLHFAAAGLLAQTSEDERMFTHLLEANRLRRPYETYDRAISAERLDLVRKTFTRDLFVERQAFGDPDRRMIFIVGMPRSGTTLTEQILASHPSVAAAGESGAFNHLRVGPARIAVTPETMPEVLSLMGAEETRQLARTFIDFLPAEARSRSRTTEKTPIYFKYLGLLALLFPQARFIHCRRDPVDTCLSCFQQNFALNNVTFSFDLEDLAHEYRIYRGYMDHWNDVLPVPLFELHYERLIAEPERWTRELLTFVDLPWDDACLAFHETKRTVATASLRQVRQPIYTSSVAKWKRYERYLSPLLKGLGPLVSEPPQT
ncbi:tetratricopeptide (TPR) repeat protein [Rhodoligotrophos appendicifer]|uniref:tetratricopeptide repeat-containing sulfotransferase family protein n=1 Tax=Rhodoligotrophos appendicifer TaxID=987056 RepID=UPI001184BCBA|nr:sulfotransferase [Rhodoligotrophos appendicifer]